MATREPHIKWGLYYWHPRIGHYIHQDSEETLPHPNRSRNTHLCASEAFALLVPAQHVLPSVQMFRNRKRMWARACTIACMCALQCVYARAFTMPRECGADRGPAFLLQYVVSCGTRLCPSGLWTSALGYSKGHFKLARRQE